MRITSPFKTTGIFSGMSRNAIGERCGYCGHLESQHISNDGINWHCTKCKCKKKVGTY